MSGADDEIEIPQELREALRAASRTPAINAARDSANRSLIRNHAGFADCGAATPGLRLRRPTSRRLPRFAIPTALTAAATLALCVLLAKVVAPGPAPPAPASASASALVTKLGDAVRLAHGGGSRAQVASLLGAIVMAAPTNPADGPDRASGPLFLAYDLFVDAPEGVDGIVVDLTQSAAPGGGVVVGFESGDGPFTSPPTYDAARLAKGSIRLASVPAATAKGLTRVTTIYLRADASDTSLVAAAVASVIESNGTARSVPVTWSIVRRSPS